MKTASTLYETNLYRCLEYFEKQTDDIDLILCGVEKCLSGYEFHTAGRTGYHLHVILSGKGVLCVNGVLYELHHGQMFVTKPGEDTWYRADTDDPWTYCWMAFDGNKASEYMDLTGLPDGTNWRNCGVAQNRFYTLVKDILDHPEMKPSNDLRHLARLLEFLSLAVSTHEKKAGVIRHEADYNADVYVDKAESYIRFNFANVKISDVAKNIGINRSYLTKIFKVKKGISPQEYLMQTRLNYACVLLTDSDAKIQDIARRVGYDNLLTFSKIFKSKFGVSPRKYSEQKQAASAETREMN